VSVPLEWVWDNDPEDLPDVGHARCIAARGERLVACGGQLFMLTTRPCAPRHGAGAGRRERSMSTFRMEYIGLDWPRGLAQQYWGSRAFDCGAPSGEAAQFAGLALLETVAGALAAGSAIDSGSTSFGVGFDDRRQPQRPPSWPPHSHGRQMSCPRSALISARSIPAAVTAQGGSASARGSVRPPAWICEFRVERWRGDASWRRF
jgi:hypothetical protein